MTGGQELSDSECLLRFIRPKFVYEDENVDLEAFVLRRGEATFSVNRPSVFKGSPEERYRKVCEHIQLKVTAGSRFACFASVGELRKLLEDTNLRPEFFPDPRPATPEKKADPSHAIVTGLPIASESDQEKSKVEEIAQKMADVATIHRPLIESSLTKVSKFHQC